MANIQLFADAEGKFTPRWHIRLRAISGSAIFNGMFGLGIIQF